MDRTAPRILNWFLAQERLLRAVLSLLPIASRWQFSRPDLQEEWGGGILRPFNVKGLERDSVLLDKNVISGNEYDISKNSFLQNKQAYLSFDALLKQSE